MPELPEVETIKRDLSKLITGKKIVGIESDSAKQVQPSLSVVKKKIVGATIRKISRRAKLLQLYLSNGGVLVIHLKLTGRLLVRKKGAPKDDWQHVTIDLEDAKSPQFQTELRFCDLRKFGWLHLVNQKKLKNILSEFGPEPFVEVYTEHNRSAQGKPSEVLTIEKFTSVVQTTGVTIKSLLMDQAKISGIGNIYANDALWLAKIHPAKVSKKLGNGEIKSLFKAIEKVLKAGIKYRGASDQYYLDALGHQGSYQDHFLVYNRAGKKCRRCEAKIKKIKIGGRGTYFCPYCQKVGNK